MSDERRYHWEIADIEEPLEDAPSREATVAAESNLTEWQREILNRWIGYP